MPSRVDKMKPFLRVLSGETLPIPPIWFMRQAGRYLPEYMSLRDQYPDFWQRVLTPEFAAEITLQPLRRFPLAAAIIFSDILITPKAMGCDVQFVKGKGPILDKITNLDQLHPKGSRDETLYQKVQEALRLTKTGLATDQTLIGFAGAPWTVACYMIEGGSSRDFFEVRQTAMTQRPFFQSLINRLTEETIYYLKLQIDAGAEVLQVFDSWAGVLPEQERRKWCDLPMRTIVRSLKEYAPQVPIIGFPRDIGAGLPEYIRASGVTAVSVDERQPLSFVRDHVQPLCPIQGCLDPLALLAGPEVYIPEVDRLFRAFAGKPWIFNLGHGIDRRTNPDDVMRLCDAVLNQPASLAA